MIGDQSGRRPVDELAADLLRRGSPLRIKARGGSMTPFLRDGDVVLVAPTAGRGVGVGDVICYEMPPGKLFLHRLIARDRDRIVAKGDALPFIEVIDRTQLLGKVLAVERRGKVKRLDTRTARARNWAIASLFPLVPWVLSLALRMRRVWRAAFHG
jgi:signal peptidase I